MFIKFKQKKLKITLIFKCNTINNDYDSQVLIIREIICFNLST